LADLPQAGPAFEEGLTRRVPSFTLALTWQAVRDKGYEVVDASQVSTANRLNVIIGRSEGDYSKMHAFFFGGNDYLGTDTISPSGHVDLSWTLNASFASPGSAVVALLYTLYRSEDDVCCPTAGGAIVRYALAGDRVQPLDPIPTDDPRASPSRR
jgi:hypothetical protein